MQELSIADQPQEHPEPPSPPSAGRTGEFVRLLTRHERRITALILSLVPNWADADEIRQETHVRLWEQFNRYVPGTDFGAWACTIARFQVMTYRKTQARQRQRLQFSEAFIDAVAPEAAQVTAREERHEALADCIERLSEVNRALVRAYYASGASAMKTATRLSRPIDSIYQSLSRIRRFLHECIERSLRTQEQQ